MKKSEKKEVVIVGAGLVGAMAACMFSHKQYDVSIYEARQDIRTVEVAEGRSINLALSVRGREALKRIGLEDVILEHGIPMAARMIHLVDGKLKEIPYDSINKQCIYSISRKYLNEILLSEAEKHSNTHLYFRHKLQKLDVNSGELTLLKTDDNTCVKLSGKPLIIGADGAYSKVRQSLMSVPMFNYSQTYIEHGYMELCIPPSKDKDFGPSNIRKCDTVTPQRVCPRINQQYWTEALQDFVYTN